MNNSFYIPINSNSLPHYFSKAIILPAKYFSNKPEDVQDRFSDSILLSKSKWTKNTDCSIEVVLTDLEIKELNKKSDNFFELNIPIPISRVKSVWFLSSKQMETTIWNINNGAAFVPEHIIQVEQNKNPNFESDENISLSKESSTSKEIAEKINRFDILLGGFAFMKLGGKPFMNYSENYFSTLSFFNKLIEEQTAKAAREKGLKFSNKYLGLFSKNDSEWSKWQHYIYQNVDAKDVEEIANKEGVKVEKKLGFIKLELISTDTHLFEIAILATYGDRKSKSTDNLVTDLCNGVVASEKAEDVSLVFGLNNGYSKFRNKFKTTEKERSVKFKLESKLDYYTIESIYQFAFNGNKSNYSFPYLDEWCVTANQNESVKGFDTYKILDTVVIAKKKQTSLEKFFQDYSTEIYVSIHKIVKEWLPPFAKSDEKEAHSFFERSLKTPLTNAVVLLQKEIEKEFASNLDEIKSEQSALHEAERKKLTEEIKKLNEEIAELKKAKPTVAVVIEKQKPIDEDHKGKEQFKESEKTSLVAEPENKFSDNYDSLTLTDLKKLAKQKGIKESVLKEYSKKNFKSLIELLRQTTPTLLL
jgi:hypothetical protein